MFNWRWWVGGLAVLLLLFSAPPIIMMGMEIALSDKVRDHFEIDRIYVNSSQPGEVEILGNGAPIPLADVMLRNSLVRDGASAAVRTMDDYAQAIDRPSDKTAAYVREYRWKEQSIRVMDQFQPGSVTGDSRAQSPLRMTINGVDWSMDSLAEVRPAYLDENRYHGYFGMLLVREDSGERLVIVQRVDGVGFDFKPETLAWRMLYVAPNGDVTEERVSYGEWKDRPELADFVNQSSASPISVGYRSGILQVWPSLLFPLLYPIGSAGAGLLMLAVMAVSLPFRRSSSRKQAS
ncbi:hypothetical protein ACFFSY_09675 [Paenibacillus aurantiacus]|uniref:DUF3068 domain-containing protein n=1 Tax=Paenibacillus aurantiacus TaxID=1936118 RepID=A0ABV5KLS2_9BACL